MLVDFAIVGLTDESHPSLLIVQDLRAGFSCWIHVAILVVKYSILKSKVTNAQHRQCSRVYGELFLGVRRRRPMLMATGGDQGWLRQDGCGRLP